MCGFVGFTGMRAEREAILHRMADRIIHRGPDMEGYHLSGDTPENAVALGFRRLSIIDLAAGKQPIYNEDGTVSIELHIVVENGVNIATVCRSIMSEVKYVVTKNTGVEVREVNVCVDSVTV